MKNRRYFTRIIAFVFSLFFSVVSISLFADDAEASQGAASSKVASPLSFIVRPSVDIPMGDSADWFSMGGGLGLGASYRLPDSGFSLLGILDVTFIPDQTERRIFVEALRLGGGYGIPLGSSLFASLSACGGFYFGELGDLGESSGGPELSSGLDISLSLGPSVVLDAGAAYKWLGGLYKGLGVTLGASVRMGGKGGSVDIPGMDLMPAFPVFYKHYDDHPLGSITISSKLKAPARDIVVKVFAKGYMDAPKEVSLSEPLVPKASRKVDVFALFNDKVLSLTEGTKVALEITVEYVVDGQRYKTTAVKSLSLYGRNAMTWDDTRKAAAFITAKDSGVLDFARGTASYVHFRESRSLPTPLVVAVAIHEALDLYGVNYATSPTTPYAEMSKKVDQVDFLQFPRETLGYKAGDCADLAILMAALLEAAGIRTAFITIPGHIFIAFDSEVPVRKTEASLLDPESYIEYGGTAWIPLEITLRGKGFLKAWELGAKEWNESVYAKEAEFFPVHDAWNEYLPVGLPGGAGEIAMPQQSQIFERYQAEIERFLAKVLSPKIKKLEDRAASERSPATLNSLAVLYARYGQLDKAEGLLNEATTVRSFPPALCNLGNIYYLKENWSKALDYYKRAMKSSQGNAQLLLAIARTNRELRDFAEVKENLRQLAAMDPELASKNGFLGDGKASSARASSPAETRKSLDWDSEE
jgi:tetratricopeptide (TPR) repeat protein